MTRRRAAVLFLVAAIASGLLPAVHVVRAYRLRSELFVARRWRVAPPPDSAVLELRDVRFPAKDRTSIAGWFLPSRTGAAVVLLHGSEADRSSMLTEARALRAAGFGVLLFDQPGHGESGGRVERGRAERSALLGAIDFVTAQPGISAQRIGALGFSDGAFTVVQVASMDSRIRAVALEGAFGDLLQQVRAEFAPAGRLAQRAAVFVDERHQRDEAQFRPLDIIDRIAPRPLVIVAGEEDRTAPAALSHQLFDSAREPKQFWLLPHAGHGDYARMNPTYLARLSAFFEQTLLAMPAAR